MEFDRFQEIRGLGRALRLVARRAAEVLIIDLLYHDGLNRAAAYRARAIAILSTLAAQTTTIAMMITQRLAHRLYEPVTRSISPSNHA